MAAHNSQNGPRSVLLIPWECHRAKGENHHIQELNFSGSLTSNVLQIPKYEPNISEEIVTGHPASGHIFKNFIEWVISLPLIDK